MKGGELEATTNGEQTDRDLTNSASKEREDGRFVREEAMVHSQQSCEKKASRDRAGREA
jgi:hypothetical protein